MFDEINSNIPIISFLCQAKALVATERTNCVVDFCDESLEEAKKLEILSPNQRGPLYGVPISIKECFVVKGYDSTGGLAKEIGKLALEDGSFVKVTIVKPLPLINLYLSS